jgi:hypothetical protein
LHDNAYGTKAGASEDHGVSGGVKELGVQSLQGSTNLNFNRLGFFSFPSAKRKRSDHEEKKNDREKEPRLHPKPTF